MSDANPPDGEFPFFDLQSLLGGLTGADPWRSAAELAISIATGGVSEPNVDPSVRIDIENLSRVAELHVNQLTGVTLPAATKVVPVNRSVWTRQSLDAYRPFFERFGDAVSTGMQAESQAISTQDDSADPTGKMMEQLFTAIGPMLVSSTAASMLGELGKRALGQYDLPIPRSSDEVLIIPSSIDAAADEWDVPADELRLWVLVHELTAHAVLSVPHVKARLESLLIDFASAFRPNTELIGEQFGSVTDLAQIQELSETLNDPDVVLSLLRSPAHDLLVPQLDTLVSTVLGFVDHAVTEICRNLVTSHDRIRERFRERWIDATPADRFMDRLLGLEIDEVTLRRGTEFVDGVLERAGQEGIDRLWSDELDLPTAAEVDAPGLWLARIGLTDDEDGGAGLDVPDDLSGLDDLD